MTDRTRTRTLAVIGLAVVLMATALILWRPFGSSFQSETAATPTAPPEREVHFPEDRSIGELYIRDWNSTWRRGGWSRFGDARGTVTVPLGKDLRLIFIGQLVKDLSPLAEIGEHDLQSLRLVGGIIVGGFKPSFDDPNWSVPNLTIADNDLRFIRELRSLRELRLYGATISDVAFTYLSGLTSLETLELTATDIGDSGLEQLGNLTSISALNFSGTTVTDEDLAELGRLPLLRTLILSSNRKISDAGLMHLRSLTRLERLVIRLTSFTDDGLAFLQSMRSLKRLDLAFNTQFSDAGLIHLRSLTRLEDLNLDSTPITDKGLAYLQSMRSLKTLNLRSTGITPNGLALLKQALPDCEVVVSFRGRPTPTPILPTRLPVS